MQTAQIIDGKQAAAEVKLEVRQGAEALKRDGIVPGLATLLVGDNAASEIYVRNKHKACAEAGLNSYNHALPKDADTAAVLAKIAELNRDPNVHGILVQLPLPPQVDADRVLSAVDPRKDADGFHPENLGRLFAAKSWKDITQGSQPVSIPCTPYGIMVMIRKTGIDPAGKTAVVVGRSTIVGKPAAALLLAANCTVTVAHSQTRDLAAVCRSADILVAAIGRARMITGDMVKPGAVVIDVGINREASGKLAGDVDFESARARAGWITPVPGGVGPMTIAMLLKNTLLCAQRLHGK